MKIRIIVLFVFILFFEKVDACSCGTYLLDLPIKEMGWIQNKTESLTSISDVIFTGTLIDTYEVTTENICDENTIPKYELLFKLITSYKGDSQDTIKIRTRNSSSACGFLTPKGTDAIIFAQKTKSGHYLTYRSDCCKSISEFEDEQRYHKYVRFLESTTNMIDGKYDFKQRLSYWHGRSYSRGRSTSKADTLDLMSYEIKNCNFEGNWKITDRMGRILEEGKYKNGQKIGTWKKVSFYGMDFSDLDIASSYGNRIETELIDYKNGKPIKSLITLEDKIMDYKAEPSAYKTIRVQKIEKTFE